VTRLVVTADDVGLHEGLTRGALAAHDDGIVTACSVASVGTAFAAAFGALRGRPRLDAGIHWVLTGERPLSPAAEVRSLTGADGRFLPGFRTFAWRYAKGGLRLDEVELELRRQLERLAETGLTVVHANGHQHLHLLPEVFAIVARLAVEHGIRFLRLPSDPAPGWSVPRGLELRVLNHLGRRARAILPSACLALDRTVGIADAGHLDPHRLAKALRHAASGAPDTAELVCHPGLGGPELAQSYRWNYAWDAETAALCRPGLRDDLGGLRLVSFRELASTA
jgi:predicted glycoside hydrolase/deacetylase ChbG (UPF0249 family)